MSNWIRDNRNLVIGVVSVFIGAMIALIGFLAYDAGNRADRASKDVKVLRQNSFCLRSSENPGNRYLLAKCHESFEATVQLVTDRTACRLIEKGAALLVINGERLRGQIRCVPAADEKTKESSAGGRRTKSELGSGAGNAGSGAEGGGDADEGAGKDGGSDGGGGGAGTDDGSGGGGGGGDGASGGPPGAGEAGGGSPESGDGGGVGGESGSGGEVTTPEASDGGKAIGVEVLPEDGPAVKAEVPALPLEVCVGKLLSANCPR